MTPSTLPCAHCGALSRSGARFCGGCGEELTAAAPDAHASAAGSQAAGQAAVSRGSVRRTADGRSRSVAWVFYGLIAIIGLVISPSHHHFLLGALISGSYAAYLFRGGRFVLWIF
jgi:hypothetical protein